MPGLHLERLHLALECLIAFPGTEELGALGDLILTQLQFLDERVEEGIYLQNHSKLLGIHDLETYRLLREHSEKNLEIVSVLNIGVGAQYPYRFIHEGNVPAAIRWRLSAQRLAEGGEKEDRVALETLQAPKKGFTVVKSKSPELKELLNDLFRWIEGEVTLTEARLKLVAL